MYDSSDAENSLPEVCFEQNITITPLKIVRDYTHHPCRSAVCLHWFLWRFIFTRVELYLGWFLFVACQHTATYQASFQGSCKTGSFKSTAGWCKISFYIILVKLVKVVWIVSIGKSWNSLLLFFSSYRNTFAKSVLSKKKCSPISSTWPKRTRTDSTRVLVTASEHRSIYLIFCWVPQSFPRRNFVSNS